LLLGKAFSIIRRPNRVWPLWLRASASHGNGLNTLPDKRMEGLASFA
jgi:hypothetical protein